MPLSRKQALMSASALVVLANTCGAMMVAGPVMDYGTQLTGSQEVPQVDTQATATSSIAVADDMSVTGSVTVSGIDATMAHIHEGAVGVSGPPIVTLVKTSETEWSVPAHTKLTPAQYQSFKAGELYVNVHSAAHKGGEIRLQLKP
jgi:CHRD domain